jgi:hypothetical protein
MKIITANRIAAGAMALGAGLGLVLLIRLSGGLSNLIRPEIVISLVVIAALVAHAVLDVRAARPVGLVRRARRRFRGETANTGSNVVALWPREERRAA